MRWWGVAPLFLVLAATPAAALECRDDLALFRWEGGQAQFNIEIADEPAERQQGLMFRESLATSAGMLFIYEHPQTSVFWMKNTLIPLDMLFIDSTGVVRQIQADAKPLDETNLPGGDDVLMVLEINGGLARRIGIQPGAELAHPRLDQTTAAYPCP